jgi:glycine/D-amino acid oxidase-like deaminating enzyme
MTETADIVVAGTGIVGMSIAYQIARRSTARIVVLDKAPAPGAGSTGASSAVCRHKYTRDEAVLLARDGIGAYRNWADFLGVAQPTARYQKTGTLWLSDGRKDWPEREVRRLAALGVRAVTLDDVALRERFPAINPCLEAPDLDGGLDHACAGGGRHLLELDGGFMDPVDALNDLIRAARARGVEVRFGAGVHAVDLASGRVAGVRLADGGAIACQTLVNAGGPWCLDLLRQAGVECRWQLEPTRIQIAYFDRPAAVEGEIPTGCDALAGVYFRPQNRGQQIIVGSILEQDEQESIRDPDAFAIYADDEFMREKVHAMQHRVFGLGAIGRVRGYSGLYTMNRTDLHPVVGPTPLSGFYVANGCSGHGFKLAPAIGSLIARMLVGGDAAFDTEVSPKFLAFDREPIRLKSRSVLA